MKESFVDLELVKVIAAGEDITQLVKELDKALLEWEGLICLKHKKIKKLPSKYIEKSIWEIWKLIEEWKND